MPPSDAFIRHPANRPVRKPDVPDAQQYSGCQRENHKKQVKDKETITGNGRGERIRTSGLYVPNVALYQAKLHPEMEKRNQKFLSAEKVDNFIRDSLY